ncbi:peptidoglycan-binding protein [Janibacter hoylei]|uniref:peptidoglycan-binding domain-containing protein n=2 Tax=Janibacter hoylei TaxID=364298 RepID=UPI002238B263|nr:peptidoglycan-binding protein [Janibacter hoylei]MCW4601030.1 peptidoglycan-binding protein [Janibacter hoylei]
MSRSVRFVGAALIPAFTLPVGGAAVARSADVPPPPTNKNLPRDLDVASPYIPQSVCDPTPKPGVTAFARLMANHYDEFNYGISRACNYGLTEHSEGRALDWMLNAYDPHERAVADGVISWLLAPDSQGRPAAMARRFGVMYIIWNRQIWGTYQMDAGWRPYNGASPHTDHIHFSFSWDGAMQRTSWWTGVAWTGVTQGPGGPPAPLPDPTSYPTLREGASGPDVQLAQKVIGVSADGVFGPATREALKTWQSKNGIKVTGILDQATWDQMVKLGKIPPRGGDDAGGALTPYLKTKIRLGSTGDAVKALQKELKISADGVFGSGTEKAVKAYQKSKELDQNGIVSPNVWRALAGLKYTKTDPAKSAPGGDLAPYLTTKIRKGSTGDAVKALQKELKISADGVFGSGTEKAVKAYQKSKELDQNGIVSPNVWRALAGLKYTKTDPAKPDAPGGALAKYLETKVRKGDRGAAVTALQKKLKIDADGVFGSGTEKAVKAYQKSKELDQNGIVSPNVWRALAGLKYTKTDPAKPDAPGGALAKYLETKVRKGDRGAAVTALQKKLKIDADGVFGSGTEKAVKAYQKSKELDQNGIVSPNVWRALAGLKYTKTDPAKPTKPATPGGDLAKYLTTKIRKGDRGAAVTALQKKLKIDADGVFGSGTERAVKAYQKSKELDQNGIVSPNVWRALAGLKYTKTDPAKPTKPATPGGDLAKYLTTKIRKGDRGAAVTALQKKLKIDADGVFGSGTERAVKAYQKSKQLDQNGIVSPNVWRALAGKSYTKTGVRAAAAKPAADPSRGATVSTSTPYDSVRSTVLASGARGAHVKTLQRALGGVAVDGVYGSGTVKAVRSFQAKEGLPVTGITDDKVWARLESKDHPSAMHRTVVLKPGSTGEAVRVVQRTLGLEVDGVFSDETRDAVKALQRRHGLTSTGYVGGVTWQAIDREARARR